MKTIVVKVANPPVVLRGFLSQTLLHEGTIYFGAISASIRGEMIDLLDRSGRDYVVWASTSLGVAGMEVIASRGKNLSDVILC